jgi:gas vesicle protein
MIPVVDQIMDCRDVCANVMLLTDDEETNDTAGWIALALTGIGFIPVFGSAIKGVGKVVVKHAKHAIEPALAVLRKLGKGDPVKYLRNINWADITQHATDLITEKVIGIKDALQSVTSNFATRILLSDEAIVSINKHADSLDEILPKIEQGVRQGVEQVNQRLNKALDEYTGEIPHVGKTGDTKKVTTLERKAERGNDLKGAPPIKRIRNPMLDKHYQTLAEYEAKYQKKLDDAIKNGDSNRRIGAFKAKLTEVKGERAASAYMEKHFSKPPPPAQMELGFGPGPGVDQIWAKRDKDGNVLEYFIVEAKGPGAKLSTGSAKGDQMTDPWIKANLKQMKNSKKYPDRNQLGQDLLDAIEDQEPDIKKLVIEAVEENNKVVGAKLQPLP